MTTKTVTPTIWQTPDELWKRIAPVLGPEKALGTPGRPATPFRLLFDALVYVLRTGCQWHALPRQEYAPGSTVHGWFRRWVQVGVFETAWELLLEYYDQEVGIDWQWQALDGVITKAPLGGEATGPSPVDRAKAGTKRSVRFCRNFALEGYSAMLLATEREVEERRDEELQGLCQDSPQQAVK